MWAVDVEREDICDMTLDESTVAEFELAIDRQVSCSYADQPNNGNVIDCYRSNNYSSIGMSLSWMTCLCGVW